MTPGPGTLAEPAVLLAAWEAAVAVPAVARGVVLAHAAGAVADLDAALDLPVGHAAALAARLHAEAFGDGADAVLDCACTATLEVRLPIAALAAAPPVGTDRVDGPAGPLTVRAPSTRDLLAVRRAADPAAALFARCVSDSAGAPVAPGALAASQRDAVDAAAEALAGAAGVVVRTACPDCAAPVAAPLDVGRLLWERVAARVPTVLAEVAELARAFGWAEEAVLALSPPRRRTYLELARRGSP